MSQEALHVPAEQSPCYPSCLCTPQIKSTAFKYKVECNIAARMRAQAGCRSACSIRT